MNAQDLHKAVTAVKIYLILMETLEEAQDLEGIPESHAYLGLQSLLPYNSFQSMLTGLQRVKGITVKDNFIMKGQDFDELYLSYQSLLAQYQNKFGEVTL